MGTNDRLSRDQKRKAKLKKAARSSFSKACESRVPIRVGNTKRKNLFQFSIGPRWASTKRTSFANVS